jgi:NAD-reducing hydrogenase small subunit
MLKTVRRRSKVLISFGDCAVTGNVTALRNRLGAASPVLERSYLQLADEHQGVPVDEGILPVLLDRVEPLHEVVLVDYFLPGCPPSAAEIRTALEAIVARRPPVMEGRQIKFG